MERDVRERREADDRVETPQVKADEEPTRGEGHADGATGVSQAAYDEAKDEATKDIHG